MADLFIDRLLGDEYPELLREIATEMFVALSEHEAVKAAGEEELARIAYRVAENVRQQLGGALHYVPRGTSHDVSLRDREIFDKFRGDYQPLAREYGLCEMRIRQIVERCRRAEKKKRQGVLFPDKMAGGEK